MTIIPTLQYRDATAAVDWLVEAFGLTRRAVFTDDDGRVLHAELAHDRGMVMLGPARDEGYGALLTSVDAAGAATGGIYVVVEDADAHCERARAAGAEVVIEPADQDYGARDYTCRDLEGNLWTFGTYDPWAVDPSAG